jgi:biopolymer transport protein ExbB/TolQ
LRGCEGDARGILATALRLKLSHRISVVRQIAGSLVILGLIGTVIGFIIALSGVHPDQAADVKAITPMVSTLIAGMSTALYTTLVGAVLNIWLTVNYHILAGGMVKLITGLLEFGEEHGRA